MHAQAHIAHNREQMQSSRKWKETDGMQSEEGHCETVLKGNIHYDLIITPLKLIAIKTFWLEAHGSILTNISLWSNADT